ncbi:MAG TPA: thioredoxin domain-containing protein [Flavobacteriales bacterium]|nr:thioredoxin domain-containing protein [Flavobacteriales bacterium]
MSKTGKPNKLATETSPYLLQHAYNPVDWYPWGNEAWEKARAENKPVIISIGYSACHWCHVMEHQSFEDADVAAIMNEFFVSIKVDREERPDIDGVYMEAVQIMTGRGGWPLNCIALPDGRPIYGGTYFPKDAWISVLQSINDLYLNQKQKVLEYAEHLQNGLHEAEIVKTNHAESGEIKFDESYVVSAFASSFDPVYGGPRKAPKFPMPCNYEFLLNYGIVKGNALVLDHVKLTLTRMAWGGIFDHIDGGFARYSVDDMWKVPHFEKMLYDNGQLMSLYAKAYAHYKDPLFKFTAKKINDYYELEMLSADGLYYSALDADSEGEEGKYYVWKKEELEQVLTAKELEFATAYYSINEIGYWEHDNYVLMRHDDEQVVAKKLDVSPDKIPILRQITDRKLRNVRSKRVKPGLDDKCLLSWNALALKGLCDYAMYAGGEVKQAVDLCEAIYTRFRQSDGTWLRNYKNGKATIEAFSEDLGALADAVLALYELTFDEKYIQYAVDLVELLKRDFFDEQTGMFYYTSSKAEKLIVRRIEIFDNVIASSNSIIAGVLYKTGVLCGNDSYIAHGHKMVAGVSRYFENAPQAMANWLNVWLMSVVVQEEMVIVGDDYKKAVGEARGDYEPLTIWCASPGESKLPLLTGRLLKHQTTIYACKNKACKLPQVFLA